MLNIGEIGYTNENVMAGSILDLRKSINLTCLNQKPFRSDIDHFKTNLKQLLENIDEEESEEHCTSRQSLKQVEYGKY